MGVEIPGPQRPVGANAIGHPDARWPPRSQRLLRDVRTLCNNWLHEPLRLVMVHFDMRLHEQLDRAMGMVEQQRNNVTRQRLLKERRSFEQHFIASIERAFDQLGVQTAAPSVEATPTLTLLDPVEHELTAALDQLVARSEARSGPLLAEVGYRLAVLIGSPPLEGDALPVGPQAMGRAFREASQALELPSDHELLLLQSLESSLMRGLAPLCEMVNAHLRDDGILPRLRPFPLLRQSVRRERAAGEPAATRSFQSAADNARAEPIDVLDNLRELLARQRQSVGSQSMAGGRAPTSDELQTALQALQAHMSKVSDHVSRELRSAQRLRQELVQQLNESLPSGAPRSDLSAEQGDTVELVAMLFEEVARQLKQGGEARSLLGGLQLPLLQVAFKDRQFFEQREHPARQLLGTVAEAAHEWIDGGGETDTALRNKLEELVQRVSLEPPDAVVYQTLSSDIEQHLVQLQHRAQVAERYHVEAMQGRERLEQARRRAADLMNERFAKKPPQGLIRTLLERAWSDVLALTLLRHGEQSDVFGKRLVITDQLLGRLPFGDKSKVQADVEAGLQQIGMLGDEAAQVAQRLLGGGSAEADSALSATGVAIKLKQHQRLGEQTSAEPTPAATSPTAKTATTTPALSAQEQRIHEHLRTLPFGTWFQFVDVENGKASERKLAWYSPVSGHSLFVTRRGQRSEEVPLPQLAHEIAAGRVREMPSENENLLDRAWRALTRNLRQGTPIAPEAS